MAQHTILSTKKIDPALKAQTEQKGMEVLEQEFITIHPIFSQSKYQEIWPWMGTRGDTAIVFTSQHAVTAVEKYLRGGDAYFVPDQWQVFCLNGATKDRVIEALSEEQVIATAPNATELAAAIIANGQFKQVVFFCGNQRLDTLPNLLKDADIEVVEIVVYETFATPVKINDSFDAILFFSPSAVKSFFSVNTLQQNTPCFAIGATTAEAIGHDTNNQVITSEAPTQQSMLDSVWSYLQH
ncbi:uroporphyrinogen-III synthase [Paraflavitalea soli]|nr:uroporphyrinogen-III synthase [Paraflavitalea soli]